jgi:hypothetical protein
LKQAIDHQRSKEQGKDVSAELNRIADMPGMNRKNKRGEHACSGEAQTFKEQSD